MSSVDANVNDDDAVTNNNANNNNRTDMNKKMGSSLSSSGIADDNHPPNGNGDGDGNDVGNGNIVDASPSGDGMQDFGRVIVNGHGPRKPMKSLSVHFMRSLSGLCCQLCNTTDPVLFGAAAENDNSAESDGDIPSSELFNLREIQRQMQGSSHASPLVQFPMNHSGLLQQTIVEKILAEYVAACRIYGCGDRVNPGVMTTIRFGLPCLRVSGAFHDADMLALVEILLKYANGALRFIHRLDFGVASREGRLHRKKGFTSHGALAVAKVLQGSKFIREVLMPRHRIGPYGASALFLACSQNSTIQVLGLRRCRIRERGALVFAELIASADNMNGLLEIDLSANAIGYRGKVAVERSIRMRLAANAVNEVHVNLEGNLVFPEIMNGCTHGLGVLLSLIGSMMMSKRASDMSRTHTITCAVYSTSLLVLYTSSTLYHSFFSLQATKYVFEVMDKCAIYILIAGSYTPFLQIMLGDIPLFSIGFLLFLWVLCILGISVEAFCPTWPQRGRFSLAMYLGMGWLALFCVPKLAERIPQGGINLLILGGVGYTAGVPFFVRNNNLDHAIWHVFVLSGSIIHWFALYCYVVPTPLRNTSIAIDATSASTSL